MAKTLETILDGGLCQGCGACAAALPPGRLTMRLEEPGYRRPVASAPLTPAESERAAAACSGLSVAHEGKTAPYHPLWGPLLTVATGASTDPEIRYGGSSGGVISALALHLVESGQAEFVLQVAADSEDPFGNAARPSRTRAEILAAAGSRYSPSSPLAALSEHLDAGRRFAVAGRPCDIASLRRLAKLDPRIDRQVVLTLAFFCAGVPSRKGSEGVVRAMGAEPEEVVRFAYRGQGWPGFARAELRGGRELRMDYTSSWGNILNRHLQFRCKICPDGTGEFADVVCADAWYGKDGYPDFAERDGRSLVLTRTVTGEAALRGAIAAGSVTIEPLDVGEIEKMQPYQATRKRMVTARVLALAVRGRPLPRYRGLALLRLAAGAKPMDLLRNFVGTYRRSRKGTAG